MVRPQSLAEPHVAESVDFSATQNWMYPVGLGHATQRHSDIRVTPTAVAGELRLAFLQCLSNRGLLSRGVVRCLPTGGPLVIGMYEPPFHRYCTLGNRFGVREGL